MDRDGRSEVWIRFNTRATSDWIFGWDGHQILNLTPVETDFIGLLQTTLLNAALMDVNGDGVLEIVSGDYSRDDEPPLPRRVHRLSGRTYVPDRQIVEAFEFSRSSSVPETEERSFELPAEARGPFRIRVFNGINGQARVESAVESRRIWLNGQEIVSPNDFGRQVSVIERTVTLASENKLQVRLGGTPGGHIAVVIEPASWGP